MSSSTRSRILDAAERLFANKGFSETSLRDITTAANVNLAGVNYHFGSKEALLSAVLDRRTGPVNKKRLELLDALEAQAGNSKLELEAVLRAFLKPPFQKKQDWGDATTHFMQIVGRLHFGTDEHFRTRLFQHFEPIVERFYPAFQRALPNLEPDEVSWRILFVIGAMAHTMRWSETNGFLGTSQPKDPEAIVEALIKFALAGMSASPRTGPSTSAEKIWSNK